MGEIRPKTCEGVGITWLRRVVLPAPPLTQRRCGAGAYVKDFTQRLSAGRQSTITAVSLIFMPIGAGLADRQGTPQTFPAADLVAVQL